MWEWLKANADTIGKLGPLVAAVSAMIAAFGAFYVYLQYRRAHDWRKGDLAAALLARLESDDELAFACQALDWGVGPIIVPKRYAPLMKRFGEDEAVLDHDPKVMALALEPDLNEATLKSARGLVYRHCFIKLFNHLENVNRLLASRQVEADGVRDLDYWLRRLASYTYAPGDRDQTFQPAIARFGYHGIPLLGRSLGVETWSVYDSQTQASTGGSAWATEAKTLP